MARRALSFVFFAVLLSSSASVARANTSRWATRVAYSPGTDAFFACETAISGSGTLSPQSVQGRLRFIPSNFNEPIQENARSNSARQRSRVKCFATSGRTGAYQVVTSTWSTDAGGDAVSATCPSTMRYAAQPQCQIDGATDGGGTFTLQFVYEGSDCGNGVTNITKADIIGQFTGASSGTTFVRYEAPPGFTLPSPFPQLNNTSLVRVGGTDMGAPFFSAGRLHFAFGDTFERLDQSNMRSQTLASTSDLNPADGVTQLSFELDSSGAAKELFPTPATPTEVTAITGAGVSVTAGAAVNRFLWFFSVRQWNDDVNKPFVANHAALAVSVNGANWARSTATNAPVWPPQSNFGPGAIWFDRFNRWIYFFGVRPQFGLPGTAGQQPWSGIRVARVRSTPSHIQDRTKYWYWSGSQWVQDLDGNLLESIPAAQGGSFGAAADLIPATFLTAPRSEISVVYDSFANRWLMMMLNVFIQQIELWQAPSITGPWSWVNVNAQLPNTLFEGVPVYAPLTADHLLTNGGEDVYFMLSEWINVYNVGQWHYRVTRAQSSSTCY